MSVVRVTKHQGGDTRLRQVWYLSMWNATHIKRLYGLLKLVFATYLKAEMVKTHVIRVETSV